jgi:hypothetical protein
MAEKMSLERAALKAWLYSMTCQPVNQGGFLHMITLCDLCQKARGTDMHELWVERDDAGPVDGPLMQQILESRENVMLLCNPCNLGAAKTTAGRELLQERQIIRLGKWVRKIPTGRIDRSHATIYQGGSEVIAWVGTLEMSPEGKQAVLRNVAGAMERLFHKEQANAES